MPLAPPAVAAAIIAAGPELKGTSFLQLTGWFGAGIATWAQIPVNVVVNGVTAGAAGGGAVFGKLFVPPNPTLVVGSFVAAGLAGKDGATLARALGTGVPAVFTASAQYTGVSAGVGAGTDISKIIVANPAALTALLMALAQAFGLLGAFDIPKLAAAAGTGVSGLLLAGTGVGAVSGPAGPAPAAGTSISKVL